MKVRSVLASVAALLVVATAGGAAPAATPGLGDGETDPLRRAAFVAVPAVYQVDVAVTVRRIVTATDTRRVNVTVTQRGTGFGVATNRVAVARHLIAPPTSVLTTLLQDAGVRDIPTTLSAGVRFDVAPDVRITLHRAVTEDVAAASAGRVPLAISGRVSSVSDPDGDVALITIDDPRAPTLTLVDSQTQGTEVALIGFGGQQATDAIPAVRLGRIIGLGSIATDERFTAIDVPVEQGDSGAPVVDRDGNVLGLVLRQESGPTPAVMARVIAIRELLADEELTPAASPATRTFRAGMRSFWQRDYARAGIILRTAGEEYRDPALLEFQRERADALDAATYAITGPDRTRTAVIALGICAALGAAAFGVALIRRDRHSTALR